MISPPRPGPRSEILNSGTDIVASFHPKGGHQLLTVFALPAQRRSAQFGLDRLNADQGMTKLSRAPHMPNMMTKATSPAAVAQAIKKRSAKGRAAPWASSTDRPPAARCERTKKAARP